MVLLIDNYDSFSYNLYQLIGVMDENIKVLRNDQVSVREIQKLAPACIVISPGPGRPSEAGICPEVVKEFYDKMPILGICLGHQVLYEAFGGKVSYAGRLMHGKASEVILEERDPLFQGLGRTIQAARYHSLAGIRHTLPPALKVIAWTKEEEIMSVRHKEYPVYGLQFHPESILTPKGEDIIRNFLSFQTPNKIS